MAVTIDMILEKVFRINAVGEGPDRIEGYDKVEVDNFLDEICDTLAEMEEEKKILLKRLEQATRVPAEGYTPVPAPAVISAPAAQPKTEESSVAAQKLLARAQKVYEDMVADAKAEADEIIQSARAEADASIANLANEKEALQQEVEMVKAAAQDYKARFLRLLEDQKHILNAENQLFE